MEVEEFITGNRLSDSTPQARRPYHKIVFTVHGHVRGRMLSDKPVSARVRARATGEHFWRIAGTWVRKPGLSCNRTSICWRCSIMVWRQLDYAAAADIAT